MSVQDVRVTNSDVGCGLILLLIGLILVGCTMSQGICERLEGIERAIRKQAATQPQTQVKGDAKCSN